EVVPEGATPQGIGRALGSLDRPFLVIDEAERIGPPFVPLLRGWLDAAPALRVLVTSRVRVPEMPSIHLAPLPAAPAQEMFRRRCRAAREDQELPEALVRDIVARLDGLPLALELAAARTYVLDLAGLAARLDGELSLLRDDERSIRATLEGSVAAQSESAREVLAVVSMFDGLVDLDSLTAVAGRDVLDDVESLLQASLVYRDGTRFGMLELVRHYSASLVDPRSWARYAAHVAGEAERAWRAAKAGGPLPAPEVAPRWQRALERAEAVNVQAQLAIALSLVESEFGPLGHLEEVRERLLAIDFDPELMVELAWWHALCSPHRDDGLPRARDALARAEALGQRTQVFRARLSLAAGVIRAEGAHAGVRMLEPLLADAEAAADLGVRDVAEVLRHLAVCHYALGDGQRAQDLAIRGLSLLDPADLLARAPLLEALGQAWSLLGRREQTVEMFEREYAEAKERAPGSFETRRIGLELGASLAGLRRYAESQVILDEVMRAAEARGAMTQWIIGQLNQVANLVNANPDGPHVEAERRCVEARRRALDIGRTDLASRAESRVGRYRLWRGDLEGATEAFDNALTWMGHEAYRRSELLTNLAIAHLRSGRRPEARTVLEEMPRSSPLDAHLYKIVHAAWAEDWSSWDVLAESFPEELGAARVHLQNAVAFTRPLREAATT
ncbi:MAG: tetratricopeptide repeat protein, partial [Myxococcota bacterium]